MSCSFFDGAAGVGPADGFGAAWWEDAAAIGAAGATGTAWPPFRRRMRSSPSRRAISVRSCWAIRPMRYSTVFTSNGRGAPDFASDDTVGLVDAGSEDRGPPGRGSAA